MNGGPRNAFRQPARARAEGLRLGTVRRPPRGVRKADQATRNYFDLWLPELAPSAELATQGGGEVAVTGDASPHAEPTEEPPAG